MKRKFLLLPVFVLIVSSLANAQLKNGNVLLGAAMGVNYNTVVGLNSGANANISPRISLAVGEHSSGITFVHQDSKASVTSHYSALNLNLFSSFMFSFDFVMN